MIPHRQHTILDFLLNKGKVDENSNLESIDQMNEVLYAYCNEYKKLAEIIENECLNMINQHFDYLILTIQKKHNVYQIININSLRRMQRIISIQINGTITNIVASKLSLDNKQCREILALSPSNNKTSKMKNYCFDILKEANECLANKVEQALYEQSKEIIYFLNDYIYEKEHTIINLINEFDKFITKFSDLKKYAEKLQLEPKLKLDLLNDIYRKINVY